jgi:hypothetical protein
MHGIPVVIRDRTLDERHDVEIARVRCRCGVPRAEATLLVLSPATAWARFVAPDVKLHGATLSGVPDIRGKPSWGALLRSSRDVRPAIHRLRMRRSGRYCWSCGRRRPNERFSRRSGLRGVCRDCFRLGPVELAYRQAVVNIDRALRHGEIIPKRHRHMIEAMLRHGYARVRAYATSVIERDARVRRELTIAYRDDESFVADESGVAVLEPSWESEDIPF